MRHGKQSMISCLVHRCRIGLIFLLAPAHVTWGVPTITAVPLPPGATSNDVRCISGNGAVVAGHAGPLSPNYLYLWSSPSIPVVLTKPANWFYYQPDALNHDGTAMTGYGTLGNPIVSRAYRWTQTLGFQELGTLGGDKSWGYAISADGQTVVGHTWTNGINPNLAFTWTPGGGMQAVPLAPGMTNGFGYGMNASGTAIVGKAYTNAGEVVFRWTQAGGTENLGPGTGNTWAAGFKVSADGTRVAMNYGQSCMDAYMYVTGQGLLPAGPIPGFVRTTPRGITPDGVAMVADQQLQCALSGPTDRASVWTQSRGMVEMMSYLTQEGINLSGWVLNSVAGVSNDGTTIAGTGTFGGQQRGWVVRGIRPICGPWIATEPVSLQACVGLSAGFTVEAYAPTVPGHVTFQWYKRVYQPDGEPNDIPMTNGPSGTGSTRAGVSTTSFTISGIGSPDAGTYFCRVYAGCSQADTRLVTLSVVNQGPSITSSPGSLTRCTLKTAVFSASASPAAAGPFTVEWTKAGNLVNLSDPRFSVVNGPNGLSSTLTITNLKLSDQTVPGNGYRCAFINACAATITSQAQLTVLPDLDGSGVVDTFDLTQVLGNFGNTVTPYTNGDMNGDGVVNTADMTIVLGLFGTVCAP